MSTPVNVTDSMLTISGKKERSEELKKDRYYRSADRNPTIEKSGRARSRRRSRGAGRGRTSSGILVYRRAGDRVEVFLVHPGRPYWTGKGAHAWSIPKGEHSATEDSLSAARREFREETSFDVHGTFHRLTPLRQPGGKKVHAWAVEGDYDPAAVRSNTFEMEWPPRSGRRMRFPEIDRAGWFGLDEARSWILPGQTGFLDELDRLAAPVALSGC